MKKSQIQMMESIIALAFVLIIIFMIVGVLISSKKEDIKFIEEINHEEMINKIKDLQNLPELKYSSKGSMMSNMIDVLKLKEFSKDLNSKINDLKNTGTFASTPLNKYDIKYISKFYNMDFKIESLYPDKFYYDINFSMIEDSNNKKWTPQYYAQVPIILVNESNNKWNYGLIRITQFVTQ